MNNHHMRDMDRLQEGKRFTLHTKSMANYLGDYLVVIFHMWWSMLAKIIIKNKYWNFWELSLQKIIL